MTTAVLLVLLGAFSRLIPHPPNFAALGAVALFSGARLPRRLAFVVPFAAMALSDFVIDFGSGRAALTPVRFAVYGSFAAIVLLGRKAVSGARAATPLRLARFSIAGSCLFFLLTNLAIWFQYRTYPTTLGGLAACYVAAIPWFWNTLAGDLFGTAALFGLEELARRLARRRLLSAAAAPVLLAFLSAALPAPARAQAPPPVSEEVVVTATATPQEESEVGSATTVITRRDIEENNWKTVPDVLRAVAGATTTQSGGPGAQTSLFLRGAASTETLVLVDGVRVNSPFFPGYDFGPLSTENVERVEVVRGPFSALYGSDAIGGVVQIFTRPTAEKLSAQLTAEAGNASHHEETAYFTAGSQLWAVAGTFLNQKSDGDRVNDDFQSRSGSVRLERHFGNDATVALEGSLLDGELGLPGPVGAETPNDRYFQRQAQVSLPATFHPADGHTATAVLGWTSSRPTYETTGYREDTDAQTFQARVADTFTVGANEITGLAGWERWSVDDHDNFGVNLDGSQSTLWHLGAEDSIRLGPAILTGGVRYDHHSQFGDAWSPRATLTWRAGQWKLRASGGSGFRAPSVGELYYPFSGNPNLQPERSVSYEVGVERQLGRFHAATSFFWNDYRDLIVYDFVRQANFNVGRARSRGIEVTGRGEVAAWLALDAGYTYLQATDLETGLGLIRRPRDSAFAGLVVRPLAALEIAPRVIFVGRRPDNDALTGERIEDPSYTRIDLSARYPLGTLVPYLRIQNLSDRSYAEVDGYPAPGRRYAFGLEVRL